jgi:flagellar motor switch protein FliN/FliY
VNDIDAGADAELLAEFSLADPAPGAIVPNAGTPRRLSGIGAVPVKIAAVLGRKRMTVAELASLAEGSILELDRRVGEPIDLYVNDHLVARGELVLVEGALGVTLTEIVKDSDR